MENFEILGVYMRYLNTSALSEKGRDLFEDVQSMFAWLNKVYGETDDELTKQLVTDLSLDCLWRTYKAARYRKVKHIQYSNGRWDSGMLHEAERAIDQIKVSERVADKETAKKLWLGVFKKFIFPCLTSKGMPALGMYIYELLTNRSEIGIDMHPSSSDRVSLYLSCNDEETLDQHLERMVRPTRYVPTECNIETMPEVGADLRLKGYTAYENGDITALRACVEDATKLYMHGYFNRPSLGNDGTYIYQAWLRTLNKYITSVEKGEPLERGEYNPMNLINVIVENSKETEDGE